MCQVNYLGFINMPRHSGMSGQSFGFDKKVLIHLSTGPIVWALKNCSDAVNCQVNCLGLVKVS